MYIPVIIPTFNNVTYTRNMVLQLQERGINNIILVDNGSTYGPMREFLSSPGRGVNVFAGETNLGPKHVFFDPLCFALLPHYFCVTDPDLQFNDEMPNTFLEDLAEATDEFKVGKAGLALEIHDREALRQEDFYICDGLYKIWEWEKQFWDFPIGKTAAGDQIYKAKVDTTLAVYNKCYFNRGNHLDAVRVAGRYTCLHLPWYPDNGLPAEEQAFYKAHASRSYYLREDTTSPMKQSLSQRP